MIIDTHAHLIPAPYQSDYLKWLKQSNNGEFGPIFLWNDPGFEKEELHLEEMDKYGISREVITYSANCMQILEALAEEKEERRKLVQGINDRMAQCSEKTGGRLMMLTLADLDDRTGAAEEMERMETVCSGYSLLTGYRNGEGMKFPDHPDYEPVWKRADETGKPVFIHFASRYRLHEAEEALPGYMSNQLLHAGFGQLVEDSVGVIRLVLSGVLDRYPRLKVVFGQLGGFYPFMLERFDMLYGMYRAGAKKAGKEVDDPGKPEQFLRRMSDYKRQIYVDTHSMSAQAIQCAAGILGREQILFGSDYPITPPHFGREHGLSEISRLPEDIQEAILWKNAATLLHLE